MLKRLLVALLGVVVLSTTVACGNKNNENSIQPSGGKTEEIVITKYIESYGINDERTNTKWYIDVPETVTRLKMPDMFRDNMMFQRNKPIRVWGLAPYGEKVTVRLYDQATGENISAVGVVLSGDNSFICELPAMEGSFTEYTLKVTCGVSERVYSNILIGDVFLASGQSNMQVEVINTYEGEELLAKANNKNIRVYNPAIMPMLDNNNYSYTPQFENDVAVGSWVKGDDKSISGLGGVSAIAYSCALQMFEELNKNGNDVPVGFMNLPVGGSPIRAWLPRYVADEDDEMKMLLGSQYLPFSETKKMVSNDFTSLFNTKIAPVVNANICGMIWYQGESDEGAIDMYKVAIEKLITSYGNEFRFEDGKMPFVMCHIAPFNTGVYETTVTKTVPFNTVLDYTEQTSPDTRAVVALYDVDLNYLKGDLASIHPRVKEPIGRRAGKALYSLACAEGKIDGYNSPYYVSTTRDGEYLIVKLGDCGSGLVADGEIKGFAVAGEDRVYYSAVAQIIDKDTIKLYSEYVDEPQYCSYAYTNLPMKANLKNKEGFAVRPFYTEKGSFYCQHDWADCDSLTVWRYLPPVNTPDGSTRYDGKEVDLYKTESATVTLDETNALSGSCLKIVQSGTASTLAVILDYPYDMHQFNDYTSLSICVKGDLTLDSVEVVGSEVAKLTLISTQMVGGYTRYNFALHNVTVGGSQKNSYTYETWLKELKFNFTGANGGVSYIDTVSLGNL